MRAKDRKLLPEGITPDEYMDRFLAQLRPIAQWLSTGEGTRLQREDSDLAVDVLAKMSAIGVVTLPMHDSFIVQRKNKEVLMEAMTKSYRDRYRENPLIK